ncbi:MAG TPA: ParB N-terminal domain-containing protein [Phycisphaerae bacterium]|nr:ParB N-terminal domain-containing protein [Phycisphaerae bacterium]
MNIEQWDIDRIKPYEKNPRRNDKAVQAVADSIREFGFRQPIVVDGDGVIVVGHTRYKAALKLGLKTVPVHVAADLTPQQARAYRLADNRTAENAEWDVDLLPIELGELRDEGFDLKLVGFSDKELAEYLREFDTDLDDGDAVTEEAAETVRCPKCGHEFPVE